MDPPVSATVPRHADNQESFPQHLLEGCEDALILFSSAFNGAQDAIWILDAGLTGTCVDIDIDALNRMEELYPTDWTFILTDAYQYVGQVSQQWDIVTVDCPTGQFDRAADFISLFCHRAKKAVILGTGVGTKVQAPEGWEITDRRRRSSYDGGVFWTVLERKDTP